MQNRDDEFLPWNLKNVNSSEQQEIQNALCKNGSCFGKGSYIAQGAHIHDAVICAGERCLFCAQALIRHAKITMGTNCTVNSYAYLQGNITMGSDVRIAPSVSIIADNHNHQDIFNSIVSQGTGGKGITLYSDIWIGANSVLLDGITVGGHSIIAAGSVVTKDVTSYRIVGGNPARVIKNRIESYFKDSLYEFCNIIKQELSNTINGYKQNGIYSDTSVNQPAIRATCDATEILAMFNMLPNKSEQNFLVQTLQASQKNIVNYEVLCTGYALQLLESHVLLPYITAEIRGLALVDWLEQFSWQGNVWHAGHEIDCLATAFCFNEKYFNLSADWGTLFTWLNKKCNAQTGLWGSGDSMDTVNGFYRLVRSTYAAKEQKLPYPEQTVNSVLKHAEKSEYFGFDNGTACNVLDVIYPLWLCKKQTMHGYEQGQEFAIGWIKKITQNWHTDKGFCFNLLKDETPTLMGSEMWLSILWYLCDYTGISHLLTYLPLGVHAQKL